MANANPTYTAANIITDVENILSNPGISATTYVPWISYAYQKLYLKLRNVSQEVAERLFGDSATVPLTQSTLEVSISDNIPNFGGFIKVEVLYGAAGDTRNEAMKLPSVADWSNLGNVSTSYRSKTEPLYYQSGNNLGIIPVAPESGANAYVRFISRPSQLTLSTDPINIPYRFIWPIINYVHARAVQTENEDYATAQQINRQFEADLEEVAMMADGEINENDGTGAVQSDTASLLYSNPLGRW